MHKKLLFSFLFILPFTSLHFNNIQASYFNHIDQKCFLKITGCATISGLASIFNKELMQYKTTQWLAKKTNTDAKDLADWCVLGSLYWGSSYLFKYEVIRHILRISAIAGPVVRIIATSKPINKLGRFILSNCDCQGVCNKCKYSLIYKEAPFLFAIQLGPKSIKKYWNQWFPKKGICPLCEDEDDLKEGLIKSHDLISPCKNGHSFCYNCIHDWVIVCKNNNRPTDCPTCRRVIDPSEIIRP